MTILGALFNVKPEPWTADALCSQIDVGELFYPDKGVSSAPAKAVCRMCPVVAQCLEYALKHQERHGVWGGMSERDRHKLRRGSAVEGPAPLDPAHCGTSAQYKQHYRRGEQPCEACRRTANREKLERRHKQRRAA